MIANVPQRCPNDTGILSSWVKKNGSSCQKMYIT